MAGFLNRWANMPSAFTELDRAAGPPQSAIEPEQAVIRADDGIALRCDEPRVPQGDGGVSWAEWKAAALNRLFQEQGTPGQPGRITAETVRHGERSRGRMSDNDSPPVVQGEASQADATRPPNRAFGGRRR
jgi:hypothetical protein